MTTREELDKLIDKWIDDKKVGNLTINFFKGGISSVRLFTQELPGVCSQETIKLNEGATK